MELMFERLLRDKERDPFREPPPGGTQRDGLLGRRPFEIPENFNHESNQNAEGSRRMGIPSIQLPKIDFPIFDGSEPSEWLMKAEYYFDIYQIPHAHKTRLAVINFVGEASAWYRNFRLRFENPPWELLIEELFARFTKNVAQELVGEFKRMQQTGKVSEYIRQFDGCKARLMHERPYIPTDFYVAAFIEGLRDDLRAMVTMFKPQSLNEAYHFASQYEHVQDSQFKRLRMLPKPNYQVTLPKQRSDAEKHLVVSDRGQRDWQPSNTTRNQHYEQRKALNLCHKCNDKWFPGHRCENKVIHLLMGPNEVSEEEEPVYEDCVKEVEDEHIEEAVVSLFTTREIKKVQNMRLKGMVGKKSVCALIDSGSTHSFINPDVLHSQPFVVSKNTPMAVMVANGNKMVTDLECKAMKFSIQGHEFEKDMRVLDVKGYDLILGLDWLTEMGPMLIDWGKGQIEFKKGNQAVKLHVNEEVAEIRLCQGNIDLVQEAKEGSEVIVAHLFEIEV